MRLTAHLYVRLPLLISIVLGVVCFFLLPAHLGTLQRVLIGWNTLAWPYLIFIWIRMLITDVSGIQRIARLQDQSAMLVLTIVIVACAASIVAILSELSALKELSGTPLQAVPEAIYAPEPRIISRRPNKRPVFAFDNKITNFAN